jgi:hypothetical protein
MLSLLPPLELEGPPQLTRRLLTRSRVMELEGPTQLTRRLLTRSRVLELEGPTQLTRRLLTRSRVLGAAAREGVRSWGFCCCSLGAGAARGNWQRGPSMLAVSQHRRRASPQGAHPSS